MTAKITTTAAAMAYRNRRGGVPLISLTACLAISRGGVLGFLTSARLNTTAFTWSAGSGSGGGGGGGSGATYTSFRGGSSLMSEKLSRLASACRPLPTSGSVAKLGVSTSGRSSTTVAAAAGVWESAKLVSSSSV